MRRLELLINDIKFNTNNVDDTRYANIRLMKLLNDAQRAIQTLIHTSDISGKFFTREVVQDVVRGQESYDLPSDIFAHNSVNSMARAVTNAGANYYTPMRQLTEKERRKEFGYILQGEKFLLSPVPQILLTDGVRVNYTYKLPTLSVRLGKVKSFTSGTDIRLDGGPLIDEDIQEFTDFVTVVNSIGVIQQSGIVVDNYNTSSGKITTSSTLSGFSVGDYVVLGEVATSHSDLPDICEQILTEFVERKIHAIDSSSSVKDSDLLTQENKDMIMTLFEDSEQDAKYPPITDDTYLNF